MADIIREFGVGSLQSAAKGEIRKIERRRKTHRRDAEDAEAGAQRRNKVITFDDLQKILKLKTEN
jgi:hypothetical protein